MKKQILSAILAAITLCTPVVTSADNSGVIGHIYSTDILAYVGKVPIDSYNIGGKTVIIAEDLNASGYTHSCYYDDEKRLLTVRSHFYEPWGEIAEIPRGKTGKIVGDVYATDIQVTYNGIPVTGYNIGGRTAICIEEIGDLTDSPNAEYGFSKYYANATWDEANRTITLNTFTDNFDAIRGLNLSRVFYTFGDNVLTVHPDDTETWVSLRPSKGGAPLPQDESNEEGYYSYWFSEGFENQTVKPLYLKTGETVTEIGSVFTIPEPEMEFERTYMHIDDPKSVLALAKTVRTPTKTYEEALSYLAEHYTEVKRLELDDYIVFHMKDTDGADLFYAVKKTGGLLFLREYNDSYRKDRIVDIEHREDQGPAELSVTFYPFMDNHGKTVTMSEIFHLNEYSFE